MRARAVVPKIALLLGTLIVGLVAVELGLRLLFPIPTNPPVVRAVEPNIEGLSANVLYERNGFGLRSRSMTQRAKQPGTLRVVCLGGSTTDQPTQNTDELWSASLERQLQRSLEDRGTRVEVAAYGRGGETVANRLAWVRRNLEQLDPDLVILMEGINDLSFRGDAEHRFPGLDERLREIDDRAPKPPTGCSRFLQLCRRLHALRLRVRLYRAMRAGQVVDWVSKHDERRERYQALPLVAEPQRDPDPFDEFSEVIEAYLGWLAERGIPTVVVGQAVFWKEAMPEEETRYLWFPLTTPDGRIRADPGWMSREMQRYNRSQRESAERHSATYVDLEERIPKDREHFFDDCHFTLRGSQRLADEIAPIVLERLKAGEQTAAGRPGPQARR